jgi:hypothetical protein
MSANSDYIPVRLKLYIAKIIPEKGIISTFSLIFLGTLSAPDWSKVGGGITLLVLALL